MTDTLPFVYNDIYVSVNKAIYHDDSVNDVRDALEMARKRVFMLKNFISPDEKQALDGLYMHIKCAEEYLDRFPKSLVY